MRTISDAVGQDLPPGPRRPYVDEPGTFGQMMGAAGDFAKQHPMEVGALGAGAAALSAGGEGEDEGATATTDPRTGERVIVFNAEGQTQVLRESEVPPEEFERLYQDAQNGGGPGGAILGAGAAALGALSPTGRKAGRAIADAASSVYGGAKSLFGGARGAVQGAKSGFQGSQKVPLNADGTIPR